MTPLRPPMINMNMNPSAKSIGVVNLIDPPHMVAIQLKIFTPVGMAISMVVMVKTELAMLPSPTVNMWWLQTPHPMNPMTIPEKITKG